MRLGILGLSPGNGHPYSWAAIINGYDPAAMATCPFPVIPEYLGQRSFPEDALPGARVTHVWTQDAALSGHVAAAARIPTVVEDPLEMIGAVDGVLLARDDAEHHRTMAQPFLEAGLSVYIDKPLALELQEARRILALQVRPGQVFSCSALRYAEEFCLSPADREELGTIRHVVGITPKTWDTYAIHPVDAALGMLGSQGRIRTAVPVVGGDRTLLILEWESGVTGTFLSLGGAATPISVEVFGDRGRRRMVFADAFSAFREALRRFVEGADGPREGHEAELLEAVAVVEAGRTPAEAAG
ncbi:MAG: Gfo/Idh/MocA family oxidoreductase [Pseudomonadota bacterium]